MLLGNADEREALESLDKSKYVRAREQSEAILKDGKSFIGTWVLSQVYHMAEGNLPRALFLVRRALGMLEGEYGDDPSDPDAIRWHKRILEAEIWTLGEMDLRTEQLDKLVAYDKIHAPPMEPLQIWPLMKLQRFDEAREIGERLSTADDLYTRTRAWNGLLALEDEQRHRAAVFKVAQEGYARTQESSCMIATNTARAARLNFDYQAAEEWDRKAISKTDEHCSAAAYEHLSTLALIQGELQRSISTLRTLRKRPLRPDLRVQKESGIKARLVELLLALGQFEKAEERVTQIADGPDRVGLDSRSPENVRLTDLVLYWVVLDNRVRQEEERRAIRPWRDALKRTLALSKLRARRWQTQRLAFPLAAQQALLTTIVRPYWMEVMPWYSGALSDMFGAGVVRKATKEARALETDHTQTVGAFLDAMEGEAAWRQGEADEALALGEDALKHLPRGNALLSRRVKGWMAAILLEQGKNDEAADYLHDVLHRFPTALRMLGFALPVTLKVGSGALVDAVSERLEASPRFVVDGADLGFQITVTEDDTGSVEMCLKRGSGLSYNCVVHEPKGAVDEDAVMAVDAFIDAAFAPKVDLTQGDINTLDGQTGRASAHEVLDSLLDEPGGNK